MHIEKRLIFIWAITLVALVMFTKVQVNAVSASCTTNSCFTVDTVTFSDASSVFHSLINVIDKVTFTDKGFIIQIMIKAIDKFLVTETSILQALGITTITSYVTSVITQIAQSCSGSSCYQNANATGNEFLAEYIIFPAIFIFGTVFGFIYMGIKSFGIVTLITTFMILGLAYIGIIPSYFTLLTIIIVGAALTKLISSMFGGNQE